MNHKELQKSANCEQNDINPHLFKKKKPQQQQQQLNNKNKTVLSQSECWDHRLEETEGREM